MKKIWAVTSGSYSDYSVLATFTTEDLARAFIEREIARNDEINKKPEPFSLWDELPGPSIERWWSSVLIKDGQVIEQHNGSLEWRGYWGPLENADEDREEEWGDAGIRFTAYRSTPAAATQRVNEYVAEHTSLSASVEPPSESCGCRI